MHQENADLVEEVVASAGVALIQPSLSQEANAAVVGQGEIQT